LPIHAGMPISRPLLIALIAAVVAVVGFYATQSTRNSTDASAPVIATAPSEPPAADGPDAAATRESPGASNSAATRRSPAGAKSSAARKSSATPESSAAHKSSATPKSSAAHKPSAARKPPAARNRPTTRAAGVPAPVARALDARKRIVLFFYKPGSADDRATARAVAGLRGQRGLAVFTDPIGRLARYRGVIGELGISQAPAVVIVGRDRTARVIEGYVDPATLAQDVTDAR
jgi:hypothetical protein